MRPQCRGRLLPLAFAVHVVGDDSVAGQPQALHEVAQHRHRRQLQAHGCRQQEGEAGGVNVAVQRLQPLAESGEQLELETARDGREPALDKRRVDDPRDAFHLCMSG